MQGENRGLGGREPLPERPRVPHERVTPAPQGRPREGRDVADAGTGTDAIRQRKHSSDKCKYRLFHSIASLTFL